MGIPIGIYSAVRQHSVGDYFFTFLGFSDLAVPDFLLGLVLMYVAYAYFDQSVGGLFSGDFANEPWNVPKLLDMIGHLWIPAVVLGTSGTAGLIRIMRNNLLDELSKPYVETARAKGLPEWKVVLKYPARIAMNPFVSTAGWSLPELFSGSLIVATVMSLPTVGPLLLDALLGEPKRAHPLVAFGRLADRLEQHFNGSAARGWRSHGVTAWCLAVLPPPTSMNSSRSAKS